MTINVDKDVYDFIVYVRDKKRQGTIKHAAMWIAANDTAELYDEFCLNEINKAIKSKAY